MMYLQSLMQQQIRFSVPALSNRWCSGFITAVEKMFLVTIQKMDQPGKNLLIFSEKVMISMATGFLPEPTFTSQMLFSMFLILPKRKKNSEAGFR